MWFRRSVICSKEREGEGYLDENSGADDLDSGEEEGFDGERDFGGF